MIRKILNVRDPKLRKTSKPVKKIDKKIKAVIKDLKDTLNTQVDPEGVGLAAPQIGKNLRIFAMKPGKSVEIVINPKILSISKSPKISKRTKKNIMEGCLSLPHYYSPIDKPNKIKVSYLDEYAKSQVKEFKGFSAQVVQHEIDHLNGVLFIDRILEQNIPLYKFSGDEWEEVELI